MARLRGHPITLVAAPAALAWATAGALACATGGPAAPVLVDATTYAPTLVLDLRYATTDNFVGARVDGYEAARCLLSEPAARALAAVQADLAPAGLGLLVFDCYRPQRAVDHFVRWSEQPADPALAARHHPNVAKRDLFARGYVAARSGHSRASTVDVALVHFADGRPLAFGTPFDFFDPLSHADAEVPEPARANRARLAAAMRRRGFLPYAPEWWHFTLAHEPYPDSYFDVPVR